MRETASGWLLDTGQAKLSSEWVVLAGNGYTDRLCPGLDKTIIPITPIQIASEPLPAAQVESVLPDGQHISDTRRVIMYARREPDNRMVFGGHGKLDARGNIGGHEWLVGDIERIYPQLRGVQWRYRWGGRIAVTEDRLPHFHEPRKGLIAGLGYNGRGVAMSHAMGLCLAQRVLGAAPDSLAFPTSSLKSIPFRAIQMMAKGSVIEMMRWLDALESRRG